jgi:hypothetical protein
VTDTQHTAPSVFATVRRAYVQLYVKDGLPATLNSLENLVLPRLFKLDNMPSFIGVDGKEVNSKTLTAHGAKAGTSLSSIPIAQ